MNSSYRTAQSAGDRRYQCDATAVWTADSGAQSYVLLDGIGDTPDVQEWVEEAAASLACAAALRRDAEAGLRAERERYAAEPERHSSRDSEMLPGAAAVVAVHDPSGTLSIAWSGDARAYLLLLDDELRPLDKCLRLLTDDHNERRAYDGRGNRHTITSYLGGILDDEETKQQWGHAAVEVVRGPARPAWLLLLSDGAYEPHEDAYHDMTAYLTDTPAPYTAAPRLVQDAVTRARVPRARVPRPHADNATALIALLPGPAVEPAGH
ncbi:hypothetical protein AB0J01_27775 [Streptomyces sp. NPDC050204]|uniref:hypothetical protein n=1 Tax=Streptomyces sp. NPDC050204 TaxID=3155514 RepID=UPI003430F377